MLTVNLSMLKQQTWKRW